MTSSCSCNVQRQRGLSEDATFFKEARNMAVRMVCSEDRLYSFDPLGNVVKASLKLFRLLIVHCAFEGLGHHQHAAGGAFGEAGCPKLLHAV